MQEHNYITFLCEVPSATADSDLQCNSFSLDVYASFSKNEVTQTRALSTIQGCIYQQSKDLKKTIDDSYILSKANGSEILLWMISD